MKRAPRSRQRHDLYAKYHDYDSEISDLLGECGLKALVADFGHEFDGTSRERIAELMADNAVIATAKQPGRYAALRGVWSTPTIFINDSERGDLGSASALDNWRAIIDPLL